MRALTVDEQQELAGFAAHLVSAHDLAAVGAAILTVLNAATAGPAIWEKLETLLVDFTTTEIIPAAEGRQPGFRQTLVTALEAEGDAGAAMLEKVRGH